MLNRIARGSSTASVVNPEIAEKVLERSFAALNDPTDREILSCWLAGFPHSRTAEIVDLAATAVRKRWEVIRARLRNVLAEEFD